ncbi:hypothetical protein D9619_013542 [Psilocybe cf. subviscida]|uniref:Uncharacterized protein n=1 Tax=Psilocybe cf. subviscida TaxID=2480587 RepID=A0A8H5F4S2_9AGAR|nr:hypothetical protein D9619_013542 [Psilocybe cf. subviscida]
MCGSRQATAYYCDIGVLGSVPALRWFLHFAISTAASFERARQDRTTLTTAHVPATQTSFSSPTFISPLSAHVTRHASIATTFAYVRLSNVSHSCYYLPLT